MPIALIPRPIKHLPIVKRIDNDAVKVTKVPHRIKNTKCDAIDAEPSDAKIDRRAHAPLVVGNHRPVTMVLPVTKKRRFVRPWAKAVGAVHQHMLLPVPQAAMDLAHLVLPVVGLLRSNSYEAAKDLCGRQTSSASSEQWERCFQLNRRCYRPRRICGTIIATTLVW